MDFDDILQQHLGEFGLFQLLFIIFGCSVAINTSIAILEYPFICASPAHSCHVTSLNTFNYSDAEIQQFVSPPLSENGQGESSGYDVCSMYVRDYANVTDADIGEFLVAPAANRSEGLQKTECTDWVYDDSTFSSTVVTEWNLVCGREWLIAASQSAYMAGQFFVFVGGLFSDRFGRRNCALVFFSGRLAGRLITLFAPNMYLFIAGRFIQGVCGTILYSSIFVLGLELVGPRWRALAGAAPYYWWLVGCMMMAGMSFLLRDWRTLLIAGTICALPYLGFFCFLPESPRWLAARDKRKKASDVMKQMARLNKRELPDDVFITSKKAADEDKGSFRDVIELFKSWHFIKITLIFIVQWNATTMVYYGLTFYLPSIGGNPYIGLLLGGLIEVPAAVYSQLTMNTWLGRRLNLSACFLLSGIVLLSALFVPKDSTWLLMTLAVLGKLGVSANWNIIYMITSEVYPTRLRSAGLMFCSMTGRIGGAISPFIAQLALVYSGLPALVMGSLAVAGGLLALLLPETRGKHLQDKVERYDKERTNEEIMLKKQSINS